MVARVVSFFPFSLVSNEHDNTLKIHIACLDKMRIADASDGAPNYVKMWQVRRDNFTKLSFFEHERSLQRHRHLSAFLGPDVGLVKLCLIYSVCMCRSLWSRTMQQKRSSPSWPDDKPWFSMEMHTSTVSTLGNREENFFKHWNTFGMFVICGIYQRYGTGGCMVTGELDVRLRLLRLCIRMRPYYWSVHLGRIYWIASQSFCLLLRRWTKG